MNMNDKILIERSPESLADKLNAFMATLILTVLFWTYNKCRKFFYFLVNALRDWLIKRDLNSAS